MKKIYFLLIALCLFTSVNAQIINFTDANLKAKLLSANSNGNSVAKNMSGLWIKIDVNDNGEIEVSEALNVYYLNISSSSIASLNGLSSFSNLNYLDCSFNQLVTFNLGGLANFQVLNCEYNQLTSLDLTALSNLKNLNCRENQLITLNISNLTNLQLVLCNSNQITSLNLSGLTSLLQLYCNGNNLLSLNASNLPNLSLLDCNYNSNMGSLSVTGSVNLKELQCFENSLTSLDVSGLTKLQYFSCGSNQFTTLNVNELTSLIGFNCSGNQLLTSLYIKNGLNETGYLEFNSCPNLQYICADESQIAQVQNKITTNGYVNCQVNSYCSFTPGGAFYTIQGNNRYDSNNNGCNALDINIPNLKFNFSSTSVSGNSISNSSGSYSIPVGAGTYTITPKLENPTYFIIFPPTLNITFPTQASPFTQDFCVTVNSVHPDLEVTILPIVGARPGFDAKYKIIYKNKGNTTQSGTVNLVFNDAVLDLIVSNPVTTSQMVNNLSWDFTNLLPFETREIVVTLNVNSPGETPAVYNGYILNYTATITSPVTDDLPNDNTFAYNQTVVNSFDPNDKTCLEGAIITPTKVGDYVHYMIRFENNGTANAQNIVVKDMIDLAKFDINSIVPIKGSHSFVTNITTGNKIEFIFENINLPFDDANNDGYVAFKIKTKSTLVLGDTFTNNASIYFDYNFPIVTNTATTTIAALSVQDFVFSNYFSVYPNPVTNVLNISAKESIEVSSINIYNTLGQLVLVIPNAQNTKTVDVSSLTTGNYFIKINSDKGTSNTKFIKN